MKALASVVLAGLMGVSLAACAKEEPKQAPVQVAQAATPQVNPQVTDAVTAPKKDEPVYKTVCLDVQGRDGKPVIDPKTGKPKQNCTKVRVREKFEGTKIEDAKKK
jgi:hypothetical protein